MEEPFAKARRDMEEADKAIDRTNVLIAKNPGMAAAYVKRGEVYDAIAGYYGKPTWETLNAIAEAAAEMAKPKV